MSCYLFAWLQGNCTEMFYSRLKYFSIEMTVMLKTPLDIKQKIMNDLITNISYLRLFLDFNVNL